MESFKVLVMYLVVPSLVISLINAIKNQVLHWKKTKETGGAKFPGPQQFPVVGRVHDLDRFCMWKKFKEWADEYGPIYQTSMLGQKFVIVSDEKIAQELLIKRGHIYAGRPQIRALIDHKLGPTYSALMDRHEIWKAQRKWVHAAMAAAYQHHFYGHIEEEVKRFLAMLLVDPSRYHDLVRELTGRVMSRLAWDDATQGPENGQSALKTLRQMSVSGPIVNTMTPIWDVAEFFRYNPWRKFEMERERNQKAWWQQLFRVARTRFLRGDLPKDTWTYRYFEQLQSKGNTTLEMSPKEEEFASCMLGFQCLVGVVTVSGPLQFFLMAMQLHPEWQKKAQAEIDRVCGDRIPDMRDWPNLPTVRACLKETLRWRSGVPLGVPHQCEQDDVFRGVPIEKGTIILACEWAINRVESKYPDPENYRPERWLEEGWPTYMEPLTRYPNFREGHGMHTFGWGRRQCLGQLIVDDEMFLAGAGVLWAFDLLPKRCPCTGKVVEFDSKATNAAVILEPLPFPMEIKPRSKKREQQILENYSAVRDVLKV